jgi:hypothetical protein
MSEARFEKTMREIRENAPSSPEQLRERVRALGEPQSQNLFRLQPALAAAVGIALAVGLGAAVVGGLTGGETADRRGLGTEAAGSRDSGPQSPTGSERLRVPGTRYYQAQKAPARTSTGDALFAPLAPTLTGTRLQRQNISMRLRVRDLSRATQSAVRRTRNLGGYVAAADYMTDERVGDSTLELRVPVQNVQKAIAGFTDLGTILEQHIFVTDLQASLDRFDGRLAAQQKIIAELEAKPFLTAAEKARLEAARRTVARLTQGRSNLVREGTYARVALQLTTRKAATKDVAPGRFDRFWDNATDILGRELIAVLYVLVLAGPFALLAALALFAERARRRRADHRLLEETG